MNKEIFLRHLDDLLELTTGTTKESDVLDNIAAWDSLAVLGFIALADQHFSTVLSPVDIGNARTVGDLMGLLGNQII